MKILITLLLIAFAVDTAIMYRLIDRMDGFRQIQKAQEDAVSRIAGKQFEDSKEIASLRVSVQQTDKELADRITKVANSLAYQQKLIDRVRAYAYNEATKNESVDL